MTAAAWALVLLGACGSRKAASSATAAGSPTAGATTTSVAPAGGGGTTTTAVPLVPVITSPPPPGATTLPPTPGPPAVVPRLRILSPHSGASVAAPFAVQYEISGFAAGPSKGGLRLMLGDGGGFALSIPVGGQSGVVYLGDNRLSGMRTLVFTLVTADQRPLSNPEATVRVANVIIAGGK